MGSYTDLWVTMRETGNPRLSVFWNGCWVLSLIFGHLKTIITRMRDHFSPSFRFYQRLSSNQSMDGTLIPSKKSWNLINRDIYLGQSMTNSFLREFHGNKVLSWWFKFNVMMNIKRQDFAEKASYYKIRIGLITKESEDRFCLTDRQNENCERKKKLSCRHTKTHIRS